MPRRPTKCDHILAVRSQSWERVDAYRAAARLAGMSVSDWARSVLDMQAGHSEERVRREKLNSK